MWDCKSVGQRAESRERKNIFSTLYFPLFALCSLLFALSSWSCASANRTLFHQVNNMGKVTHKTLDRLVWENSLKSDENISNTLILKEDLASYHLIQIRGSEEPHLHEVHDLAVFMQSGLGTMVIDKESFKIKGGSIVFIPHGTPHYFMNGGIEPAVAIAVFSPAYDGKDTVPIRSKKD